MRYLAQRLGLYLITLWAALTINFLLPRLMPGNPAIAMLAKFNGRISPNALKAIEIAFGLHLHQSLMAQYGQYLTQLIHGNLGISLTFFPTPVATVIGQALPWTIGLVGMATVISFAVGMLMGIYSAWRRGGSWDAVMPPVFTMLSSFPYFWVALAVLYVVGFKAGWFPISGAYTDGIRPGLTWPYVRDIAAHGVLPAFTIVLTSVGYWAVNMRNTMMTTLTEDYVTMARAKGLRDHVVMFGYAARNAILPNVTGFAMSLGFVVSGAILTEVVFSYPGVGYMLFQAVQQEDYPLIQGLLLMIVVAVLAANLMADLLYAVLDPRVGKERS
jgi:peptide/nickel transport system permease protein